MKSGKSGRRQYWVGRREKLKTAEAGKFKAWLTPEYFVLDLTQAAECSRRDSRLEINTFWFFATC